MNSFLKNLFFLAILFISSIGYSQMEVEKYAGKKYNALYKKAYNDTSFMNCRVLTSATGKVNGVELFFKNDIHYIVSFKKSRLNDSYSCESGPVRGMRIYAIHYYKGQEYQKGYCRCNPDEQVRLISPSINSETED